MIVVKPTVFTTKLTEEIYSILPFLDGIFQSAGVQCTITSWMDSKHAPTSKHYDGLAIDLRSYDLSSEVKHSIFETLKAELPEYLVLLENEGTDNEHFHIQIRR